MAEGNLDPRYKGLADRVYYGDLTAEELKFAVAEPKPGKDFDDVISAANYAQLVAESEGKDEEATIHAMARALAEVVDLK